MKSFNKYKKKMVEADKRFQDAAHDGENPDSISTLIKVVEGLRKKNCILKMNS